MAKKYGYMRVSTKEQNEERQRQALLEFGIKEKNIFVDKATGRHFKRPEYDKLRKLLKKGDLLVVESIDRLGRSYNDILKQWNKITKYIGADIKVLDMPLLDTSSKSKGALDKFISDIILLIQSYTAEQELHSIKQRQTEGIAVAKLQGKHIGRPKAKYPEYFDDVFNNWINGKIDTKNAIKELNVTKSTFYRLAKNFLLKARGTYEK